MSRIETSILINRPVTEVWDFAIRPENMPAWGCGLLDVTQITDGPVGVGTRFSQVLLFLGKEEKETTEILEYEPYRRIVFKVVELPHEVFEYTLEPVMNSTNVVLHVEFTRDPADPIPEPFFMSALTRIVRFSVETLKDLVEFRAAVPA